MQVPDAHQYREQDTMDSTGDPESVPISAVLDIKTYESSVGQGTEEQRLRFQQIMRRCTTAAAEEQDTEVTTRVSETRQDPLGDQRVPLTYQEMIQHYPHWNQLEHQNYWRYVMVAVPVFPMPLAPQVMGSMQQPPASPVIEDPVQPASSPQARGSDRSRSPSRATTRGNFEQPMQSQGNQEDLHEWWRKTTQKRLKALQDMRSKEAYLGNCSLGREVRLQSPDPYDCSLSKRVWEKRLGCCRIFHRNVQALHEWLGYDKVLAAAACKQAAEFYNGHSSSSSSQDNDDDDVAVSKLENLVWNKALEILGPVASTNGGASALPFL